MLSVCAVSPLVGDANAAPVSVSVVPGTLTQGASTINSYANEANNINTWATDTGTFGGTAFGVGPTNGSFAANTIVGFGNGGGVTLKFDAPIVPLAGQKEFGLFTAQFYNAASGGVFNGNMEAAVLVGADNVNWFTLSGVSVANPTTYVATSSKLNAPSVGYDYLNGFNTAQYGSPGTTPATLAALTIADYQTPMPNDNLFNGTGTAAERMALFGDTSEAAYDAVFGSTGGGNWFDISNSGLSQVNYLRLNAVNTSNAVRLDSVFANSLAVAAVPEPSTWVVLACGAVAAFVVGRRKAMSHTATNHSL
ncbi:MAG: hypothetical protein QM811_15565 [Pirellulales bacterium]